MGRRGCGDAYLPLCSALEECHALSKVTLRLLVDAAPDRDEARGEQVAAREREVARAARVVGDALDEVVGGRGLALPLGGGRLQHVKAQVPATWHSEGGAQPLLWKRAVERSAVERAVERAVWTGLWNGLWNRL